MYCCVLLCIQVVCLFCICSGSLEIWILGNAFSVSALDPWKFPASPPAMAVTLHESRSCDRPGPALGVNPTYAPKIRKGTMCELLRLSVYLSLPQLICPCPNLSLPQLILTDSHIFRNQQRVSTLAWGASPRR